MSFELDKSVLDQLIMWKFVVCSFGLIQTVQLKSMIGLWYRSKKHKHFSLAGASSDIF